MPDRPKPSPAPKAFDVFKPGKTRPSPTSRPVIVADQPQVQDHTLVEKHGAPVSNAHRATISKRPKPVLKSLLWPRQSANAPAASQTHHSMHRKQLVTHTSEPEATDDEASKKVSRNGSTIAPPSASTAHKLHPVAISTEEPNLAAVPITPVGQPSSLMDHKTEGKEELLAAMPVEIRRSIASAEGTSASDWDRPIEVPETPAPPTHAETASANVPRAPEYEEAPDAPAPETSHAAEQPAPATQSVPEQPAKAEKNEKPEVEKAAAVSPVFKTKKRRSSDIVVFIIMLVLFLLLGSLVILLFLSGSVTI